MVKNQARVTSAFDPRLLAVAAQVWFLICLGWLVSIMLSLINVYTAFVCWIVLPNLAAMWGRRRRRLVLRV